MRGRCTALCRSQLSPLCSIGDGFVTALASTKLSDYVRKRAVNSGNAWTATTPLAFMNMPILTYIKEISPRPILLVHGERAHSRYFSETAYAAAAEPKELVIVPGANHVDLYDDPRKIPFDRLNAFFRKHLAGGMA